MLDVGDGQLLFWESCDDRGGIPAVVLHGGPAPAALPARDACPIQRPTDVVLFDQGGDGRSTPHVSDPGTDLSANTTDHLVADTERLRA